MVVFIRFGKEVSCNPTLLFFKWKAQSIVVKTPLKFLTMLALQEYYLDGFEKNLKIDYIEISLHQFSKCNPFVLQLVKLTEVSTSLKVREIMLQELNTDPTIDPPWKMQLSKIHLLKSLLVIVIFLIRQSLNSTFVASKYSSNHDVLFSPGCCFKSKFQLTNILFNAIL